MTPLDAPFDQKVSKMVIFAVPYIMPVTTIHKETHAMDKLVHNQILTQQGKHELIQIIKKIIFFIEQKDVFNEQKSLPFFDTFKLLYRKSDGIERAVLTKNIYEVNFYNSGDLEPIWRSAAITFQQAYKNSNLDFSFEDFKELPLKLEAILLYEKTKYNNTEYYIYQTSLIDNPKIKILFSVTKKNFNRLDIFPKNFYSINIMEIRNGKYEDPNAKILYLNKK